MRSHFFALIALVVLTGCDQRDPKDGSAVGPTTRPSNGVAARGASSRGAGPTTVSNGASLAGLYARRCLGERLKGVWSEITLDDKGRYSQLDHGVNAEFKYQGSYARAQDRLTLSPDDPLARSEQETYTLRQHRGRKMLLWGEQLEAFEVLPSWQLGYVELESPDERESICSKLPKLDNPPDPSNPEVRLPQRLDLVLPARDPGGSYAAHVTLKLAPYEGQVEVCRAAGCGSPDRMRMPVGAWLETNRTWWAIARAAKGCPDSSTDKPDPARAYTISYAGRTMKGELPPDASDAGKPDPCAARNGFVHSIQLRITSMHPP